MPRMCTSSAERTSNSLTTGINAASLTGRVDAAVGRRADRHVEVAPPLVQPNWRLRYHDLVTWQR
jgi:hypothetical protein